MALRARLIDSAGSSVVAMAIAGSLLFQALWNSRPNLWVVPVVALLLFLPGIVAAGLLVVGFGLDAEQKRQLTTGQATAMMGACICAFAVAVAVLTYSTYVLNWSELYSNPYGWVETAVAMALLLPGVAAVILGLVAEPRPETILTIREVFAVAGACICALAVTFAVLTYSIYVLNWPNLIHFFCAGAALLLLLLLRTVRPPRLTNLRRRGLWAAIYSSAMLSGWFVPPGWARALDVTACVGLATALWLVSVTGAVGAQRTYGRLSAVGPAVPH